MNSMWKGSRPLALSAAAALVFVTAAPVANAAHRDGVSIGGVHFDDDEELFDQLVDLDADDIADIRDDLADARADIAEAIEEITDAREEARGGVGEAAVNAAMKIASGVVERVTGKAFGEARAEIAKAAEKLALSEDALGPEEFAETSLAIEVLTEELAALEAAIDELLAAMRNSA